MGKPINILNNRQTAPPTHFNFFSFSLVVFSFNNRKTINKFTFKFNELHEFGDAFEKNSKMGGCLGVV